MQPRYRCLSSPRTCFSLPTRNLVTLDFVLVLTQAAAPSTRNKQQATELPFSPPTQLRVPSSQSLSKDRTDDLLRLLRLLLSNIHPHLLQLLSYGYRLLSGLSRQHARLQRNSRLVPTIPTLLPLPLTKSARLLSCLFCPIVDLAAELCTGPFRWPNARRSNPQSPGRPVVKVPKPELTRLVSS